MPATSAGMTLENAASSVRNTTCLLPRNHPCGNLLRHHDGRDVGVGARHGRHDRGVDHAEAVEAANPAGAVDHRVAVGRSAHPAGAGDMEHAGDVLADVLGKRVVVLYERSEIDLAI